MFFLIAPLLFIGFFSPDNSVTVDSENKKSNEHLISLRDYDFVGEDQRLSALLAERMAVLQAPLNLSEPETGGPAPKPAGPWPRDPAPLESKPDYLHSNVRFPQLVNVSMDYAEFINASDWLPEVNASLLALASEPGGAPAPRYGRVPAPGTGKARAPEPSGVPAPGTGRAPFPSQDAQISRMNARRTDQFKDPSYLNYNKKTLDIMKQCIYTSQSKMSELDYVVVNYERDPRFRMAYIYNRIDEWFNDMRTVLYATLRYGYYRRRVKRIIWYYEHMLRLNIDITYSIEHLVYLHTEYMKHMDNLLPLEQRLEFTKMRKEQKKLNKMRHLGLNKSQANFLKYSGHRGK